MGRYLGVNLFTTTFFRFSCRSALPGLTFTNHCHAMTIVTNLMYTCSHPYLVGIFPHSTLRYGGLNDRSCKLITDNSSKTNNLSVLEPEVHVMQKDSCTFLNFSLTDNKTLISKPFISHPIILDALTTHFPHFHSLYTLLYARLHEVSPCKTSYQTQIIHTQISHLHQTPTFFL